MVARRIIAGHYHGSLAALWIRIVIVGNRLRTQTNMQLDILGYCQIDMTWLIAMVKTWKKRLRVSKRSVCKAVGDDLKISTFPNPDRYSTSKFVSNCDLRAVSQMCVEPSQVLWTLILHEQVPRTA